MPSARSSTNAEILGLLKVLVLLTKVLVCTFYSFEGNTVQISLFSLPQFQEPQKLAHVYQL